MCMQSSLVVTYVHSLCCFVEGFGNIVTMAWWDELWLNEGEATRNFCNSPTSEFFLGGVGFATIMGSLIMYNR